MNARRIRRRRVAAALSACGLLAGTLAVTSPSASASHGAFPVSAGIYRIPYADGSSVNVTGDHHNHGGANGTRNRIDLAVGTGTTIVAAAGGWVRAIVDNHGNSPGAGDGLAWDGVTQQFNGGDDSLEHSCQDIDNDGDGTGDTNSVVFGRCSWHNNYVWLEHPNGEWTKYSHFGTGTVTGAPGNLVIGQWVNAGDPLGSESDIGFASGSHLHWEVAVPTTPGADLSATLTAGGFFGAGTATNAVPFVCDINTNLLDDAAGNYTAAPCTNQTPTADAGGPYVVNEGSTIQLDGSQSSDPDGTPLTYAWAPDTDLDDPSLQQPTFTGVDDAVDVPYLLTVYDQTEQWPDVDATLVTVLNVPPTVTAVGDAILEADEATVSATFTDPGTLDTHTAAIFWGDGTFEVVAPAALGGGVGHVYGDNGTFDVTVAVLDDDGGLGIDVVQVVVGNRAPVLTFDHSGEVSFPGGDHQVVGTGEEIAGEADGEDAGSDDLTFSWSSGDVVTYFNDGVGPDPFPSPDGVFPFFAGDATAFAAGEPGVDMLLVELADDDGGMDDDSASIIVTGDADVTEGNGWWKHQFSTNGAVELDAMTRDGYREIVNAVSSVFDELVPVDDDADVHAILSPADADIGGRARAQLMVAWLQFASGAVAVDAAVPLGGGETIGFLDLMFTAETVIANPASSNAELGAIDRALAAVRHAE